MPDFPKLPIITPPGKSPFPDLPIITPGPPRATLREKYGNFYYLVIAGLAVSIAMVTTFAVGVWLTRDMWAAVWVLHDSGRPEPERIKAAWHLARHPSFNDLQKEQVAFLKPLPGLARYVVAESMTSEAIRADPKGYAVMVAKSDGWPDWLRLVMIRPMAYGVGEGYRIAWEPLDLLRADKDPAVVLWATYTRAVMPPGDARNAEALARAAATPGRFQALAALLDAAAKAEGKDRLARLDEATSWMRTGHPVVAELWKGWEVKDGQLVEKPVDTRP